MGRAGAADLVDGVEATTQATGAELPAIICVDWTPLERKSRKSPRLTTASHYAIIWCLGSGTTAALRAGSLLL